MWYNGANVQGRHRCSGVAKGHEVVPAGFLQMAFLSPNGSLITFSALEPNPILRRQRPASRIPWPGFGEEVMSHFRSPHRLSP